MSKNYKIAVLPGDGTGPEVSGAAFFSGNGKNFGKSRFSGSGRLKKSRPRGRLWDR